jgi:hypothetical protein
MDATSSPTRSSSATLAEGIRLRWQQLGFRVRAIGLQLLKAGRNALQAAWRGPLPRLAATRDVDDAPVRFAFVRGEHRSPLWTHADATEWTLTAGKVHNLRVAARALDGLVVPAGVDFSFWAAVGRPVAWRGYVPGRELREGCLVVSTGGGLCQLSNALYAAALQAGAHIVERHAHSRRVPGSQAARGQDATVFWNYVDLRFRLNEPFELEVDLDDETLNVRLRAQSPARRAAREPMPLAGPVGEVHDCARCERHGCPERFEAEPGHGRTRAAVPAHWPEHLAWTRAQQPASCDLAEEVTGWRVHASRILAWRWRHQPAKRRHAVLALHDARARAWAKTLRAADTELVVPLDWLALLACEGGLRGRRYSVLMTRAPLSMLHHRLDEAAARLALASLHDFRASPARVAAEWQALQGAVRVVTPHAEMAAHLRAKLPAEVVQLDWQPAAEPVNPAPGRHGRRVLFPASSLARMGAVELRSACRALGFGLDVLGRAEEDAAFWHGLDVRRADAKDPWRGIGLVVLPPWVETSPRRLVEALARGLPVIATPACGLPEGTPGCRLVPAGDAAALTAAVAEVLGLAPARAPSRRA